jgi:hypothetical protein
MAKAAHDEGMASARSLLPMEKDDLLELLNLPVTNLSPVTRLVTDDIRS